MTITYLLDDSLYINMTNRCTNACSFCVRSKKDSMGDADSLWFTDAEPSKEEILKDILQRDLKKYKEIVFCGYGEPLMRFDDVLWICKILKKEGAPPIRINTNGLSDIITGRDTACELSGVADTVSISLNAPNAARYDEICASCYGEDAFDAMIHFARRCVECKIPNVVLSVVDILSQKEIEDCRKIAEDIGALFRVRCEI